MKKQAWLIAGSRTPVGSFGRSLKNRTADQLAEHVIKQALRRAGVKAAQLDGIVLGHAYQNAFAPNTARFAALQAGVPGHVPALTVQRQCGSGMEAVSQVVKDIKLGQGNLYLAGGVESMSTIPYLVSGRLRFKGWLAKYFKFGPRPFVGLIEDGIVPMNVVWDKRSAYMAGTAQCVADAYGVSREAADTYALRSQMLAAAANAAGRFEREIDPIVVAGRGYFVQDEHIRLGTTIEKLASLPPVLKTRSVTAGNSSGINDGACALVVCSDTYGKSHGLKPLAIIKDTCVVGVEPEQMGLGPVVAIEKLLVQNQLSLNQIDLFEINEAFAAQYLACEKLLGLDRSKVNVNGGAIALGHPIGMTGARLILTLAHELALRGFKYGIAALCVGGGMGIATLIEAPPNIPDSPEEV